MGACLILMQYASCNISYFLSPLLYEQKCTHFTVTGQKFNKKNYILKLFFSVVTVVL